MIGRSLTGLMLALLLSGTTRAEDAGRRNFPATLVVEEPQVETEIAPQVSARRYGEGRRADFSSDLSLKLSKPLALIVNPDYTVLRPGGRGFQALETGLKYQFTANAEHEFIVSAGLLGTLGGTGSTLVGAERTTSAIPTVYYGKGAGDLPDALAWARPFAVTGQVALAVPLRRHSPAGGLEDEDSFNPFVLGLAGSLQYSLPYAAETLLAGRLPEGIAKLVPLIEYEIAVPVANTGPHAGVVGTINPGALYVIEASNITWGLEVLIPINRASGGHPGARLQLSYSFDTPWPLAGKAPD